MSDYLDTTDDLPLPEGSQLILMEQAGGLTVEIPPRGAWRGSMGFFGFGVFWLAITVGITVLMIFKGTADLGRLASVAVMIPFWVAGITMLLLGLHLGRRHAAIAVIHDRLSMMTVGLFGAKQYDWTAAELRSIGVGPSGIKINDKPVPELQIVATTGKKKGFFAGRDIAELRWLAKKLNAALKLSSDDED